METTIAIKNNTIEDCLKHTLFPWSQQANLMPMEIVDADGSYFYTSEGEKFLDFSSQLINMNFGHKHPKMTEAVVRQMNKFSFITPGAATQVKAELGKQLAEITPKNLTKVFYTVSGAEANENAIKIARLFTGKEKIITLYRSYHGATYGAISAGGDPRRHPIDRSAMPGIVRIENPYFYRCPWGSSTEDECRDFALAHLERVIKFEGAQTIAAILLEGESGTSGCIKYPKGYWKGVAKIAKKHHILTISDEVMSGFGRTGEWFGVQGHRVNPDMLTMAKGITGGYLPLGGVMVSDEIACYFEKNVLPLGLTNAAHPLSLAAANAAIKIYKNENLLEKGRTMGKYLKASLQRLMYHHNCIGDIRITGLLGCLEIVKSKKTKEPMAPFNANSGQMKEMNEIRSTLKKLGIFTLIRWNFIFLAPPLNISKSQVDKVINGLHIALSATDKHCY